MCPRSNERIEHSVSPLWKERLKKIPLLKALLRTFVGKIGPITDYLIKKNEGAYAYYLEACPRMILVECEQDNQSLERIMREYEIDIFLPSINILPEHIPYVTYWPDCQPKHYPEFFNDEAQRVRDDRINGLFSTGRAMIINSLDAKNDMLKFYTPNSEQIFNLPFAPIIEFEKLIPRPEISAAYGITGKYFMVCNQFWIHKSIETVITAANLAKNEGLNIKILFTGKMQEPRKPSYIDMLRQMVVDLGVGNIILFLDYIPKDDQIELMKGSVAIIQPTLFEGGPGGGSIYDAVSLGVRAIASNIPINHELPLSPKSLLLFEKQDPKDLLAKMKQFLEQHYEHPSAENLYQQSKQNTQLLSKRLYEAIDYSIAGERN